MDGKTMIEIRQVLLDRWKRIGKSGTTQDVEAIENVAQSEMIDMAQALEQVGREMSLAEQERRELVAIERALAKMSVGNFGLCEDCGEEIPSKRLLVLPQARLCANCQAFEEKQQARTRNLGIAAR